MPMLIGVLAMSAALPIVEDGDRVLDGFWETLILIAVFLIAFLITVGYQNANEESRHTGDPEESGDGTGHDDAPSRTLRADRYR